MKKALCLAAVALMFSSMAFGVSAVVNSDGSTVKAESGMMAITAVAPDTASAGSTEPTPATESPAVEARDAQLYTTQNEAKSTDKDASVTDDTNAATTGLVATNEEVPSGETRYYTTGAPEAAQQEDHTLLYVLSIVAAALIVGIPITMKLLKKAE